MRGRRPRRRASLRLSLLQAPTAAIKALVEASRPATPPPVPAPAVPESRQGLPTGAGTGRRRGKGPAAPRAADANALVRAYVEGRTADPPWEALGAARAPVIGGRPLDLKGLWARVRAHGGYDGVIAAKKWAAVAGGMGMDCRAITNAGWLVRYGRRRERETLRRSAAPLELRLTPTPLPPFSTHYLRFLMPLETEMQASGEYAALAPPPPGALATPAPIKKGRRRAGVALAGVDPGIAVEDEEEGGE